MQELDKGHLYLLDNLLSEGSTELRFFKDPALHGGEGYAGTYCQEVIRAIIARVEALDEELHWEGNAAIIKNLRLALAGFEARALIRRVVKENMPIEKLAVDNDGHLLLADWRSKESKSVL